MKKIHGANWIFGGSAGREKLLSWGAYLSREDFAGATGEVHVDQNGRKLLLQVFLPDEILAREAMRKFSNEELFMNVVIMVASGRILEEKPYELTEDFLSDSCYPKDRLTR